MILRFILLSFLIHAVVSLGLMWVHHVPKPKIVNVEIVTSNLPPAGPTKNTEEVKKRPRSFPRRALSQERAPAEAPVPAASPELPVPGGVEAEAAAAAAAAGDSAPAGVDPLVRHAYYDQIRKKVAHHQSYPRVARMQGLQGKVLVSFLLSKEGLIIESKVETSSGYEILDRAALEAVRSAQPYPPFPASFPPQPLCVEISLVYDLKE